jgi:DNA-binding transcriptional regulator YdaS (Cro superfamily)
VIDNRKYKAALAMRGLRALDMARALGVPPTTLASWINCVVRAPDGLEERVERVLGVEPRSLRAPRAGAAQ